VRVKKKKKKKIYTTSVSNIVIFDILLCNLRHGLHYSRSVNKRMTKNSDEIIVIIVCI
jgi:hypothetical protein